MKRNVLLMLSVVLIANLFAGLAAAETDYTYTMVMQNFGPLDEQPKMVEHWNSEYGVNFELIYVENASAYEQINLMVTSGEIPDVMQYINQAEYYSQGIIGGWTEEFFRENAPNISAYIDSVNPDAWNYAKFDGELMYSIPGFRMFNSVAQPLMWRTDWLENVGFSEPPKTLEEVEKAFYAFVEEDPDGNGVKDTYAISKEALSMIYGAHGFQRNTWIEDGEGGVLMGDVMPAAKDALALLAKWYRDGIVDPEFITGENHGGYWAISHAFLNNRIGVTGIGGFYHWIDVDADGVKRQGPMVEQWEQIGQTGTFGPGPAPIGPDGHAGTTLSNPTTLRTTFSANLVADTERFARLLQIIDDMNCSSIEKSAMVARGMPGEEHQIVDWAGRKALVLEPDVTIESLCAMGAANWFAFIEEAGNYEYQEIVYAIEFYWYNEAMADIPNKGYRSAIFGALPSQATYKTECDKILNEGYVAIITGDQPLEYFDEMVAQWYAAGGEILTQEANELYAIQSK